MSLARNLLLAFLGVIVSMPLWAQNSAPSANLALTPPMGWNSWNKFACNVSEDMIKGMADAMAAYANMRAALDATGRPIVLSICEWGKHLPWLWGEEVGGNLWRTTDDIQDRWSGKKEWSPGKCCSFGVTDIIDANAALYSYAGPGHWNDPDMLEVGNGGMT